MKLFAFVRRCRRLSSAPVDQAAEEEPAAVAPPAEKRRRRPSGPAWKPTLGAISEDVAVASSAAAKAKPAARTKAKAKGKAAPPPPPRRVVRSEYDDFRHYGAPTVLPAFAPTAFLF
ncbi:uncharacterized protein LOC127779378 [Oryza glaberrima]|uniref:Uncharacterized protein n=2 Tax=Oryza TaxID=4527 RepID=A0A0D3GS50_9ORYZ|nr:uncharacterized protein LOC127779378 [Oryza glaberrima]